MRIGLGVELAVGGGKVDLTNGQCSGGAAVALRIIRALRLNKRKVKCLKKFKSPIFAPTGIFSLVGQGRFSVNFRTFLSCSL